MTTLSDILWLLLSTLVFVAYLFVVFQIVADLFRDHDTSGWIKALWVVALLALPVLTAIVYLVARGKGMAQRQRAAARKARDEATAYMRDLAGTSSVDQIARAKSLLDAGTINQAEFAALKQQALASASA